MHGDADEVMPIANTGDNLHEVAATIPAGLASINARVPPQELVAVNHVVVGMGVGFRHIIGTSSADRKQRWIVKGVASEHGEIMGT